MSFLFGDNQLAYLVILCNICLPFSDLCFDEERHKNIEYLSNELTFELTRGNDVKNGSNYAHSAYSIMNAIIPMMSLLMTDKRHAVESCFGASLKDLQAFMYARNENKAIFTEDTKIWLDKNVTVQQEILSALTNNMVKRIDIQSNPGLAEKVINAWVSNKTHGIINHLLPQGSLTKQTNLLITNAISFIGSWKFPFDAESTRNRTFHINDNVSTKVPTMANTIKTLYYKKSKLGKMILLPYKGDSYGMYLLLPSNTEKVNFEEVIPAMKEMQPMRVKVIIPKFKIASSFKLGHILSNLGFKSLFSKVNVLEDGVYFKDILHKVSLTVDELGTKAGGGTAVVTVRSMVPTFRANRPFYFFIKNLHTGVIIFSGKVQNPGV